MLSLKVLDRGAGFDRGGTPGDGMGLAGLRDRVESLGGTLTAGNRIDGPGAELDLKLDLEAD